MLVFRFFVGRVSSSASFMAESGVWYEDADPVSVSNASKNLETPVKFARLLPLAIMVTGERRADRTREKTDRRSILATTLPHSTRPEGVIVVSYN